MDETTGVVKVIAEDEGKIIGATVFGPHASDLIHIFSLAIYTGLRPEDMEHMIFAHPTLAEALKESVDDVMGRAIHKVKM